MTTKKAAPKKQPATHWWFSGASVVELVKRLSDAGSATARLEVRIDSKQAMTFRVVPGAGAPASALANAAQQQDITGSSQGS